MPVIIHRMTNAEPAKPSPGNLDEIILSSFGELLGGKKRSTRKQSCHLLRHVTPIFVVSRFLQRKKRRH